MNIFGKKKGGPSPLLEVTAPEAKGGKGYRYNIRAALAKALLLFMLMFGAVGGFLSAYGMEYNRLLCAAVLFGLSLILGLLYETGIRSVTNLAIVLVFIVFAYLSITGFRVLNSGAYAVINKMYETARGYLGVIDGNEYSLQIQDTYRTVTGIAVFVGVVGVILVAIRTQYKAGFWGTFLMTFLLYPIPLYFDRRPDQLSMFLLLASYGTLLIVQCSGSKTRISEQIRRALPIGIALSAAVVLCAGMLISPGRYRMIVPKNPQKEATEGRATVFAQFGVIALFQNYFMSGGVSGGLLSNSAQVMPRYKTDLIVRFTPYNMEPIYLKAFAGLDYTGDRWLDVRAVFPEDDEMMPGGPDRREWFAERPDIQGRGIMEVTNADASAEFEYRPYYTEDDAAVLAGDTAIYIYYPPVSDVEICCEPPDERYLQIPDVCYAAVERACREAGLIDMRSGQTGGAEPADLRQGQTGGAEPADARLGQIGRAEEIAGRVIKYFDENYVYTLRPGYYFGSMDFISYFLDKNKKGYCSHFASAGTMIFRYMGIPARYVEGYAFSYADMALEGRLLEEAYEDYYSGYSPLGETALVEVEVTDARAHAWVEIYIEGKGWVVVDPTPAAREEEDVGGFWENFGFDAGEKGEADQGVSELSAYLENILEGSRGYFLATLLAAALFLLGRRAVQKERERRLPAEERVQLEYRRLAEKIAKSNGDFAVLTTPAQEIEWICREWELELPEGFADRFYRVFFAPEGEDECEELCRELIRIRGLARRGRPACRRKRSERYDGRCRS